MHISNFSFENGLDVVEVCQAAAQIGCFYANHPLFPAGRCADAVALAHRFFDLPDGVKQDVSIARSPHFRGYSELRNERDWREQIHFGRECVETAGPPEYRRLIGPNLWPDLPGWRREVEALIADLETVGRDVLKVLGVGVDDEDAYLLLKMIHYGGSQGELRTGIAPHVDFSWITLVIQDSTGGLEMRTPGGEWLNVPPEPGTLVVNLGEILEVASNGKYRATPHRVVGRPVSRISLPFFVNPGLDSVIGPLAGGADNGVAPEQGSEHIHRVFRTSAQQPFVFGDAEWRRKGLGIWCSECVSG